MISKVIHRGGCGFCCHYQDQMCRHPENIIHLHYLEARKPGDVCGPAAMRWEYLGSGNGAQQQPAGNDD